MATIRDINCATTNNEATTNKKEFQTAATNVPEPPTQFQGHCDFCDDKNEKLVQPMVTRSKNWCQSCEVGLLFSWSHRDCLVSQNLGSNWPTGTCSYCDRQIRVAQSAYNQEKRWCLSCSRGIMMGEKTFQRKDSFCEGCECNDCMKAFLGLPCGRECLKSGTGMDFEALLLCAVMLNLLALNE